MQIEKMREATIFTNDLAEFFRHQGLFFNDLKDELTAMEENTRIMATKRGRLKTSITFRPNLARLRCSSGRRQTCTSPNPSGRDCCGLPSWGPPHPPHSVAGRIRTAGN